jgi:hypothetical protein
MLVFMINDKAICYVMILYVILLSVFIILEHNVHVLI